MIMSEFLVEKTPAPIAGFQRIYKFENELGASVIPEIRFHFGKPSSPRYELAVTKWDGKNWDLNYNTPITSDVLRYLTADEVETNLRKISKLEKGVY